MFCTKCNKHLSECTCPDLKERLEKLKKVPQLLVPLPIMGEYEKQAERNLNEQTKAE
jgi:hypothetical protein